MRSAALAARDARRKCSGHCHEPGAPDRVDPASGLPHAPSVLTGRSVPGVSDSGASGPVDSFALAAPASDFPPGCAGCFPARSAFALELFGHYPAPVSRYLRRVVGYPAATAAAPVVVPALGDVPRAVADAAGWHLPVAAASLRRVAALNR